jgi:adenosylhomocysteine nucleosidase
VSRILVLTALDVEARGLARHLGLDPVHASSWPRYAGGRLEISVVGLGARALAERGEAWPAPNVVVSAGACGALAPELEVGELVTPETVLGPDGQRHATAALAGLARRGTLLTTDQVVGDGAAKARLWLETGALAVDMESAAILRWAADRGVRGVVLRGVSDTANRGVPADLARVVSEDGRVHPMRAVTAVLARPAALADAMALRAGTAAALKTVAAALGKLSRAI